MRDDDPPSPVSGDPGSSSSARSASLVVIDLDSPPASTRAESTVRPALVVGHSTTAVAPVPDVVDIALTPHPRPGRPWVHVDDLNQSISELRTVLTRNSMAAAVAVQVMRATEGLDAERALQVESLAYGALQGGPEHARWLADARRREPDLSSDSPRVVVERWGDELSLTFNRPHRRNAYDARTRDELIGGLELALLDDHITTVHLRGEGPSFGSGGDLSEFGTVPDGVTAHLIRSARNAARLLATPTLHTVAHVHGPCFGAGVELSAACSIVLADPDTTMTLPEVVMGLIPGAGGTWSVPRRIGRQRATWLALTGATIDARSGLDWGLVDEIRRDNDTGIPPTRL